MWSSPGRAALTCHAPRHVEMEPQAMPGRTCVLLDQDVVLLHGMIWQLQHCLEQTPLEGRLHMCMLPCTRAALAMKTARSHCLPSEGWQQGTVQAEHGRQL